MKDICNVDILKNGDVECMPNKKRTKNAMLDRNNQFIICTYASFSPNNGKCAFGYAILVKCAIVY